MRVKLIDGNLEVEVILTKLRSNRYDLTLVLPEEYKDTSIEVKWMNGRLLKPK